MAITVSLGAGGSSEILPVTPKVIELRRGSIITKEKVLKLGEVSLFGGTELKTVTLESFFPNQKYPFCNTSSPKKPAEYVDKFNKWLSKGQDLTLNVSGTGMSMTCIIKSFTTKVQDGTGDVYYKLELLEYRIPKIEKLSDEAVSDLMSTRLDGSTEIKTDASSQRTTTVTSEDNLWTIAKKQYGSDSDEFIDKLIEANKDKYPNIERNPYNVKEGWELVIPNV